MSILMGRGDKEAEPGNDLNVEEEAICRSFSGFSHAAEVNVLQAKKIREEWPARPQTDL